ncbi:MAG: hypothetical protein Q9227_001284 [Pyrenula ochraceoflavens]
MVYTQLSFNFIFALLLCQHAFSMPLPFRLVADIVGIEERQSAIPDYAITYETHFPADLAAHLTHVTPEINFTTVADAPSPLTLDNLNNLNSLGGTNVYLTAKEGVNANPQPSWFNGVVPDSSGKTQGATSCAIIVADKGNGETDVFYFYFYAFDQGNKVLGIEFGDHIGDWEHNMIRFQNGVPQSVWYSQHSNGEAFTYNATQKVGVRPVTYVARGTHANYAIPGTHDHTIPGLNLPEGPLEDYTSQGALWDPTLNAYEFAYSVAANTFTPYTSSTPVNWLYFNGQWGDQQLPNSAQGQYEVFGEARYVGGPTGPDDKDLGRTEQRAPRPYVMDA